MRIFQVDAFSDVEFKGNPAAVCILERKYDDATMQNIAMEMNLSETAFVRLLSENEFDLRWFTPEVEIDLCGHATLASAHILWQQGMVLEDQTIYFYTLSGRLTAKKIGDMIELDFPAGSLNESSGDEILVQAFSKQPLNIYEDDKVYVLEFLTEDEITSLAPDFTILKHARRGHIIATSPSSSKEYDFVSRFFGPALGVNEDPVTGSAHCYLAPLWAKRLSKDEVVGFQASKRTGIISCKLSGDRVLLRGMAKTILMGTLLIDSSL